MLKIVTIVGARPQIIKAAALSRTIRNLFSDKIKEFIVHTGQHYDNNMSEVFFGELEIPNPDINLNIGSASHGQQTAQMLQGIEKVLLAEKPDFLVLYGDTNSTLAGVLAGIKLQIPVVHIEAGLRSFNKKMPEEINRIVCDHASTLLFVPTENGMKNLANEGFAIGTSAPFSADKPGIFHCGDIMFDNLVHFSEIAARRVDIMQNLSLQENSFLLCTIHRDNNTDNPERIKQIISTLLHIEENLGLKIVFPLHPRTSKMIESKLPEELYFRLTNNINIHLVPPVTYLEMIMLEKNSRLILTDSGGVQKEAYFFKKQVVVARPETEWVEIVENGAGIIADADEDKIIDSVKYFLNKEELGFPNVFGDGHAAEFICRTMLDQKSESGQ
ncbi:MAG: non-hydrolyzing UDP-N-acetylglucosamine 2-epimerase [Bacteroidales bacterium]